MTTSNASTLRHRIVVSALGGIFALAALVSGGVAGANFNHASAQAETAVVPVTPGLCVIGCGRVSGAGSVGAPIDR